MKVSSIMQIFQMPILASIAAALAVVIELGHVDIRVPFSTKPILDLEHSVASNTFTGQFAVNAKDILSSSNSRFVLQGLVEGPEHLVYKSSASDGSLGSEGQLPGTLWTASVNGTAYSVEVSESGKILPSSLKELVYTGPGRALGLAVDGNGGLYLCNAVNGLLYWGGVGHHKVVANRISESSSILPGAPITYVNSVAVAPNGKVYFTASGDIPPPYQQGAYNTKLAAEYIALEGRKSGMLLEYDPETGHSRCLATGIWFANGVDVSADGSYALFAETFKAAILKHWLEGPKAGTTEELLSPFPALVDNVLRVPGTSDSFWVGLAVRPSNLVAGKAYRSKVLRAIISYLPANFRKWAAGQVGGGVLINGKDGSVERVIADPTGSYVASTPSGVLLQTSSGLHLYMGSLENDFITHTVLQ